MAVDSDRAGAVPRDLRRQPAAVAAACAAVTLPYTAPQAVALGGVIGVAADVGLLAILGLIAFLLGPDLRTLDYSYAGLGGDRTEVLHSRELAVLAGIAAGATLGLVVLAVA